MLGGSPLLLASVHGKRLPAGLLLVLLITTSTRFATAFTSCISKQNFWVGVACSDTDARIGPSGRRRQRNLALSASSNEAPDAANDGSNGDEEQPVVESVVRIDDGGSDLSDRFKYKVNALMGVFDPQTGVDDEYQEGNILNAMLKFPIRYSFIVVGKTKGDDALKEQYINQVKDVVGSLSGDEDRIECRITPRGKNFTRLTLQVTVDSVTIINSIYKGLEELELTVMKY